MPKDPPRNQPNYKIGGDHINEYEYSNNKGQLTEEEKHPFPRPQENQQTAEEMNENSSDRSKAQNS